MTLDTAAYEALYAKRADFVITFAAWEGIEAKQRGIDLRTFKFGDYGFPDFYQVVLACDSRWLAAHPDLARAFVGATAAGSTWPPTTRRGRRASSWRQNPGVFDGSPELPAASQRFLATGGYLRDAKRRGRAPDARRMAGLLRLPVRPGAPGRSGRQAADRRRPTTRRCSRTTSCRESSRTGIARWGPPLVLVGLVVLAWEAYVRLAGLDPITLPPPSRVVGALWDSREAAAGHLVPTLVEAMTGCAVSVVLAVADGHRARSVGARSAARSSRSS